MHRWPYRCPTHVQHGLILIRCQGRVSNLCPTTPCLKCVSIRSLRPVECASVAIPLSNSCPTWSNSYKVPRSCVQLMSNYTMSKRCVYSKSKACRMRTGGHTVGQLVSKLYPTAPMICKWRVYPSLRGAQLFIRCLINILQLFTY